MNEKNAEIESPERRDILKSVSAVAGLTALAGALGPTRPALAQAAAGDTLPNGLPRSSLTAEPAVVDFDRPLDLSNLSDAWYAKIKATNNLRGAKSYVAMFSRGYLCPQGTPAQPTFGHCGLWTWQLQVPTQEEFPDARPDSMVQRALYTGVILDPYTFEPVDEIKNPVTGKTVAVEDSTFAMNFLLHPQGGGRDRDNERFFNTETRKEIPHVRFGDEVSFVLAGIFQGEGKYQPRTDSSWWSTNYNDLIDPGKHFVDTRYNFTGIMRAWERKWLGIEKPDMTQLLWSVEGKKFNDVGKMPEMIEKYVLEKYPDRI
ncbi:MAG: hypothetical protein AAGH76_03320 [Pseudomonadota bacterium]